MKIRSNKLNLVEREKNLLNLIYAVCMSFCELKMSDDKKALIRDNRATAKLWFPDGIYEIVQVYENNDIRNPNMILGSILNIIGSIAKNKYSNFPIFHKTFHGRSLDTNQFYFIISQLKKSDDVWHIIDSEIMEKITNQLKTHFTKIEVINLFSELKSDANFKKCVTCECDLNKLLLVTAENACLVAFDMLLSMIHNEFKVELDEIDKGVINRYLKSAMYGAENTLRTDLIFYLNSFAKNNFNIKNLTNHHFMSLKMETYTRGASAGTLFGYLPSEVGARIGSYFNLEDGLSLKSTCKLANIMALEYVKEESKNQKSLMCLTFKP